MERKGHDFSPRGKERVKGRVNEPKGERGKGFMDVWVN